MAQMGFSSRGSWADNLPPMPVAPRTPTICPSLMSADSMRLGEQVDALIAQGARVFSHPQCHHVPEVYDGIAAAECEAVLKGFFAARR